MSNTLRPAICLLLGFTLLTGIVYPLVVTGAAQLFFPHQANGSLVKVQEKVVGSELIGQSFDQDNYFWSRPSATGPAPYQADASAGSNLGPTNPALLKKVKALVEKMRQAHPEQKGPVPVDLVTASASGLDPHLSVAGTLFQVERVAKARALDPASVRRLVLDHVEPRCLGLLGEPRVNVLRLNLALNGLQ